MKLNRLFNGKKGDGGTEISGSFSGHASGESLLGKDDFMKKSAHGDETKETSEHQGRGRVSSRLSQMRRSLSERPSLRKRSKSEVGKRLQKLQGDYGAKTETGASKSVGGVFRGTSREVDSKIESLALERTMSDSKIDNTGGFDSLFDQPVSKPVKKLRGGRRRSAVPRDDNNGENEAPQRSRSTSSRRRRSSSAVSARKKRSGSKRRASSKARKPTRDTTKDTPQDFPNSISTSDKNSVSTLTTKDSKKKKKKKKDERKKKKDKDGSELEISSIPSKVEMDNDCDSQGSITMTMNDSFTGRKKKAKDKPKKMKQRKTKNNFPELRADDFGDGLEGLAEEFRRSKERYGEEKMNQTIADYSSGEVPISKNNVFENAWNDTEKSSNDELQRSHSFVNDEKRNPFAIENSNNPFEDDEPHSNVLQKGVDYETKVSDTTEQQEEILKLQQQLSTALQKQLTMSEEHIKEKNEFMNVSREFERVKVEFMASNEKQDEILADLAERDRIIEEDRNRIDNLEEAIDKQLEKEDEMIKNVQEQEEEIEKLLDEIQNFEKKLENGESGGGGASFVELRNARKDLSEREKDLAAQKLRVEELEKELTDAMTVPQLQIEELDQENKALQGRLKGERLEYTSKLSAKDDVISSLRTELTNYTSSPDAQDLSAARQKLMEAREDATTVREDLAATQKVIEELHGEREDFMEEFNLMKDNNAFMEKTVKELTEKADGLAKKVLEWTEKTYDWKERAEKAERKVKENGDDKASEIDESEASGDKVDPQGMFLQSAMDKGKKGGKTGLLGLFNKNSPENQDMSPEEVRLQVLEEQNQEYEAKIAQLSSDIVKMQSGHKEEVYMIKKKIAQLELENDAFSLQNSTLEKLNAEANEC
mmetsp:Transcript_7595/g.18669  ORF Transcript_7595/g.18669 Transcript_7595/m.18669 type:complete len:880 (-) Transcript_7595:171-2810(-)